MDHVTQMAKSLQNKLVFPAEMSFRSGREMFSMPPMLSPDVFSRRSSSSRDVTFTLPPLLSPDLFRRRSSSAADLRASGSDGATTPLTPSSPRDMASDCGSRNTTPSPIAFFSESPQRKGLGRLNPDIYRLPSPDNDDVEVKATLGRLWFSLVYDASEEKLTVTVIKAKKLPQRSRDEPDSCDPVVRVHLLPDKRRYLQSQQKKNTCNPRFDEEFPFMIPQRRLAQHSIRISVYDSRRDRKHVPLGSVMHSLRSGHTLTNVVRDISRVEVDADSGSGGGSCAKVVKVPAAGGTVGGVLVGLTYNAGLERLNVAILEAVELESANDEELPSTYAKVTMYHHTRGLKSKRTETVRECCSPKYAESFNMSLPADNLSAVHIRVQIKQKMSPGRKDVTLGRVTIGSHMFARGHMQEHWEKMLQNPKEQIQMWHVLKAI
ncbi:synaptotagmin-15-like [Pollicipes pollicipes]|uniref:synaptotagmin-15-like n=1 Tax=Pollicipes pollicipes TaxID=41117 RepID=UPI0018855393|nr:synaptotagmin-15-like [Pollicipes pollicipes]